MENPQLYQEISNNQTRDAIKLLEKNGKKMRWKSNCKVVDLGSGDGHITANVLPRYLPSDFNSLLGIDISKEMVSYSNLNYGNHKITFSLLDLAGPLPSDLKGAFHHALSFYVLHWINDQEKAFQNIYDLLTNDGDCLLMFVGWSPLYDVCRHLSKTEKWKPWLSNTIDSTVVRYHNLDDPIEEVRRIMTEIGFKNVDIKCIQSPFNFDGVRAFKRFVQALNLFKLPKDLLEEFSEDVSQTYLQQTGQRGSDELITVDQRNLVVYGSK